MIQRLTLAYRLLEKITLREVMAFLLIVLVSASYIPIPILLAQLLKQLQLDKIAIESLLYPAFILVCIFALQASGAYLARKILIQYIKTLVQNIRLRLLQSYLKGLGLVKGETTSGIQKKIFSDAELVDQFYNSLLTKILPAIAIAGVSVGLMLYVHVLLTVFALALSLLVFAVSRYFKRQRDEILRVYHNMLEQFNKKIMFVLRFRQLISLQSMTEREIHSIRENLNTLKKQGVNMVMGFAKVSNIDDFAQSVVIVITLLVSFWFRSIDKIQPEEVLMFFFVIYILRRQITAILNEWQLFSEGLFAINAVYTLERDLNDLVPHIPKPLVKGNAGKVIEFRNVAFHYPHASPLLVDVNFSLPPQNVTLIQGPNGVGKSTLMNLVLGYLTPVSGSIAIDHVNFSNVDLDDFRSQVGVVQQESDLFDGSLRDNLLYGVVANDQEVKHVLDITGLESWVSHLPLGLDTSVNELEATLSGGQKQRLTVARALLKKPRLLIMDEPTNHLDAEFTTSLLVLIKRIRATTTVLLISHDKALETIADQKIKMYDGKIESIFLA